MRLQSGHMNAISHPPHRRFHNDYNLHFESSDAKLAHAVWRVSVTQRATACEPGQHAQVYIVCASGQNALYSLHSSYSVTEFLWVQQIGSSLASESGAWT